jgi:sulfotransferase
MNRLHFCGGLPRSGSTILMNILQQNPKIFTTGTCALPDLISDHILIKSRYREMFQAMSVHDADKAMYGLIHGATKGWFEGLTNKEVVISKNRNWSSIFHLYKDSKYIVMVRDIRDIVESFEKVNHKTLALHSFGDTGTTSPAMHELEKYHFYFQQGNALQASINFEIPRLMERYMSGGQNNIKFVRYEDFTQDPVYILKKIYEFLGLNYFEHDLNNIQQQTLFEHDHAYFRERTDHVIDPVFKYYKPPVRTLPDRFHEKTLKEYDWFYKGFYPDVIPTN